MALLENKYCCDGEGCANSVDLAELIKAYDEIDISIERTIKAQDDFNNEVTALGWRKIDGRLFCKDCVNKLVSV
jgi:transketolase